MLSSNAFFLFVRMGMTTSGLSFRNQARLRYKNIGIYIFLRTLQGKKFMSDSMNETNISIHSHMIYVLRPRFGKEL